MPTLAHQHIAWLNHALAKRDAPLAVDDFLTAHAQWMDTQLIQTFNQSGLADEVTLLATGGYGRGELYPASDIDFLVLIPESLPTLQSACEESVRQFLQKLWDQGLKISQAVRTLKECRIWAKADVSVLTALLEARYMAGRRDLAMHLQSLINEDLDVDEFIIAKEKEQLQRHQRYQNIDSSLEPNIKESPGALREWHVLRWIERAFRGVRVFETPTVNSAQYWQHWVDRAWVLPEEAHDLIAGEFFLRRLRLILHHEPLQHHDKLLFDIQPKVSVLMGYADGEEEQTGANLARARERMMKDYYRTAQQSLTLCRLIIDSFKERRRTAPTSSSTAVPSKMMDHGLVLRPDGVLDVADEATFLRHPEAIFQPYLFRARQEEVRELSANLKRHLRLLGRRIGQVRHLPTVRADFMDMIKLPNGPTTILRELNRQGILGDYLPVLGQIVGLLQHDLYHAYTVDQHILMVVRNLRRLMLPSFAHEHPELSQLMADFPQSWRLIVAAIFHDIAKGRGGNHSELGVVDAQHFCQEHGINEDDTALIAWIVKEHLTMSRVAQHEDINDPEVVQAFADKVRTTERLKALYLFTCADIRGTSPKVWNQWKAHLLSELFHATLRLLQNAPINPDTDKRAALINSLVMVGVDDGERWWRTLHHDYRHAFSKEQMMWHFRVWLRHQQKLKAHPASSLPHAESLCLDLRTEGDFIDMVFIAPTDGMAHALAKACGHLAHMDYSVMSAKIAPWQVGEEWQQLVHLTLCAPSEAWLDKSEGGAMSRAQLSILVFSLRELLLSSTKPPPLVTRISRQVKSSVFRPHHRLVLDDGGGRYILSVSTLDRLGLLYDLMHLFAETQVVLYHARINTLGNRAENTFVFSAPSLTKTASLLVFEEKIQKILAF